jgi:hypothetical protein
MEELKVSLKIGKEVVLDLSSYTYLEYTSNNVTINLGSKLFDSSNCIYNVEKILADAIVLKDPHNNIYSYPKEIIHNMRLYKMENPITPSEQIENSKTIIRAVLMLDIHEDMKRKVVDTMLWNITGAFGKFHTKYISEGAKLSKGDPLRHEHVFTKKSLINRIMDKTEDLDKILLDAIGCVVTKYEHERLHNKGKDEEGWKRYIKAEVGVWELDDDLLNRRLDIMTKGDIMNLPFEDRIITLDQHTTQCDLEKLANSLAVSQLNS